MLCGLKATPWLQMNIVLWRVFLIHMFALGVPYTGVFLIQKFQNLGLLFLIHTRSLYTGGGVVLFKIYMFNFISFIILNRYEENFQIIFGQNSFSDT